MCRAASPVPIRGEFVMSATTGDVRPTSAANNWRTPLVIIVCGCIIALLSFGPRSSLGFFVQPMSREFAWGRDVFGLALALQNLLWGLGQPIAGAIADRFGIVRVMVVGALLYAGGLFLMRYSATPLSLALATPAQAATNAPAADEQSFKTALAEAFGHRSYVLLVLGFFTCGFQLAFITVHLPAYLVDRGIPASTGGWVLAAIGLFNIIGSLRVGWLPKIFPQRYLLSVYYFTRALAVFSF